MNTPKLKAQDLKNSILQYAIRGKLVPQDPNDEPASVLLERIKKEKQKLVKAGKIKPDMTESTIFRGADKLHYESVDGQTRCIEDEIPFEIPENWQWVRLGSIALLYTGNSINAKEKEKKYTNTKCEGYNYIATKDVKFDCSIDYNNGIRIPLSEDFRIAPQKYLLQQQRLLTNKKTVGVATVLERIT